MTTFPALHRFSPKNLEERLESAISQALTIRTYQSAENLNFVARNVFMKILRDYTVNHTVDVSYISGFSSQFQRSADALNEILRTERHLPLHSLQLIEAYAQTTDSRAQRLDALCDASKTHKSRWQNYCTISGQQNRDGENLKWAHYTELRRASLEEYYGHPKDSGAITRALGRLKNFVTNGR